MPWRTPMGPNISSIKLKMERQRTWRRKPKAPLDFCGGLQRCLLGLPEVRPQRGDSQPGGRCARPRFGCCLALAQIALGSLSCAGPWGPSIHNVPLVGYEALWVGGCVHVHRCARPRNASLRQSCRASPARSMPEPMSRSTRCARLPCLCLWRIALVLRARAHGELKRAKESTASTREGGEDAV